jgi:two-component system response regulator TtrR
MHAKQQTNLNVYVVDDDDAVRRSLGLLLLSHGHAVQTFESGEAFLAAADLKRAGCVILDLRLGAMSGLQVFDELRAAESPVVVLFLSGHGDIPIAVEALQKGAFDWLEKPCMDDRLLKTVDLALQKAVKMAARQLAKQEANALWAKLTPRERQVARHVAVGKSNKRIALDLAPFEQRTVETHRAHVFAKLALSNSTELARFLRDYEL